MPSRRLVAMSVLLLPIVAAHAAPMDDALQAVQRKDYAAAVRLLQPLAEAGDARAQVQLGTLYYHGHGVAEDDALALRWYDRAARQGHAQAQYLLANLYAFGHAAVPEGHDAMRLAAQWYFEAARQGHMDAQYSLGLLFLAGSGVTQSAAEARKWFDRAARQGHADAKAYLKASARR
jgi:TPR repeat protein